MVQVTSIEEYKKVLKEYFPNQEDFDKIYLGIFEIPITDPPWYVIAPQCAQIQWDQRPH